LRGLTISEIRIILFPERLSVFRRKIKGSSGDPDWVSGASSKKIVNSLPCKRSRTTRFCVLLFSLIAGFGSCGAGRQASVSFYEGFSAETPEALSCFERALESSNAFIRDAAALELIPFVLSGAFPTDRIVKLRPSRRAGFSASCLTLKAAASYVLGSKAPGFYGEAAELCSAAEKSAALRVSPAEGMGVGDGFAAWSKALSLMADMRRREISAAEAAESGDLRRAVFSFLLSASGQAAAWVSNETFSVPLFSETEKAALKGHEAAARSSFAEGLGFFRTVIEDRRDLFFRYPELLQDLGRCFQYAAPDEGTELFLEWENLVENAPEAAEINGIRFRLLFFAARMARQRGLGTELFNKALAFAPDSLQKDACIWYILDMSLSGNAQASAALVKQWIPFFNDYSYFSDILDRLARMLTANRQWKDIADIYALINGHSTISAAQYGWILGRAAGEGWLGDRASDGDRGGDRASTEDAARPYFRRVYEQAGITGDALYYRMVSAAALGEPFLNSSKTLPPEGESKKGFPHPELMEFLLGFFEHDAENYAASYLREKTDDLSVPELRAIARAMHGKGLYAGVIRLVSAYMNRGDYEFAREDLELAYPRPWRRQVEQRAEESGLAPELLFGLIRTESAFQPDIVSRAGAAGLTQLMAATAEESAGRLKRQGGPDYTEKGGPDLLDPEVNIHLGAVYLRYLVDRLEDTLFALIAYNGGITRFRRWRAAETELPGDLFLEAVEFSETRAYGRRVLAAAAVYRYLYYGKP
jgi:soluble lytic murein transglycosylase